MTGDPSLKQTDLSAWTSKDLGSIDSCTVTISPGQVEELCAAVEGLHVPASPLDLGRYEHRDFPLPGWQPLVSQIRAELDHGRGFVRLRGLPFDNWDAATARLATWGVGLQFGEHLSQTIDGQRLCDVTDTTHGDPSARQFRTNRELSLHTDPVSHLIGLACYRAAEQGGESILVSARHVRDTLAQEFPAAVRTLAEGFIVHRFGEGMPEDGPYTHHRVPVLTEQDGRVLCRYVRTTIAAGHREAGVELTAAQLQALDAFDEICRRPANQARFRLERGDLVLVNNLGVLHARTAFVDRPGAVAPRLLFRLWLEAPYLKLPVLPEMNYFNRGRCGIPVQTGRTAQFDLGLLAPVSAR